MALPPFWQITPLGVLGVLIGIAHEVGLARLAERQSQADRRRMRRRSLVFYSGLIGMVLVASGPLERWAMKWLSVHMVTHVVEMFYLPPLLVLGGPLVPIFFSLAVAERRTVLRTWYRSRSWAGVRRSVSVVTGPVPAIVLFNGVMVLWHIPAVFNWASWHQWPMGWLMTPSFVVSGVLFWRIFLPSHPRPPRGSIPVQLVAIVVTAFEMLVLAMALGVFTKAPWYSMNVVMDGSAAAMRDQHWAAGILWVCGDFWAVPALVLVGYRLFARPGGRPASLEGVLDGV